MSTPLVFELYGEIQQSKELQEFFDSVVYAEPGLLDYRPPKRSVTLTAKDVEQSQVLSFESQLAAQNGEGSFTLATGASVSGLVTSFSAAPVEHSSYYDIKMGVRLDGTTNIVWHLWGDFSSAKELLEFYGGMPGTYSPYTLIDAKPPRKIVGLRAEGATLSDVLTYWGMLDAKGTPQQFTTVDGYSVQGIPTHFHAAPIGHTGRYTMDMQVRVDGSVTPLWAFYATTTTEKQLIELYEAPSASNQYGQSYLYDMKLPRINIGVEAKGATGTVASQAALAAETPGATFTVETANGLSVSGIPTSVAIQQIEFTNLYSIRITLRVQ